MDQADTNKQGYRECKQDKKDYVKKKKINILSLFFTKEEIGLS